MEYSIQIKQDLPPSKIYDRAKELFGDAVDFYKKNTVFAYDGVIYSKDIPDPALFEHESVHIIRQNMHDNGPDGWWEEYFTNNQFRLDEEILAYKAQYKVAKRIIKDRERLFNYVNDIAGALSGPMYGNLISKSEAKVIIM